jgi:alpha-L-fucosidase
MNSLALAPRRLRLFGTALLLAAAAAASAAPTLPLVLPVPSPEQRAWQDLDLTMFVHFGMNTFTDREWGNGTEDPKLFNPAQLDARQWVRAAQAGGFKLVILTAKHHDGFCLWPSKFTEHSVKHAAWKDGQGDVVREFVDACHATGMKVGLYLSPWDRHEPSYGTDAYNTHFTNQLAELLTNYAPVDEVWFDGACGEGPNGKKQVYNWPAFHATIRALAPKAVIAICGPDVRWVGNESGVARAGESSAHTPSQDMHGRAEGKLWWPAECDVSIRPGWFYHAAEDGQVKSVEHLLDIYFKSVGRNSVMLLNVPPNRAGLFAEPDVRRLKEFGDSVSGMFARDLARGQRATASAQRLGAGGDFATANLLDGQRETFWAAPDGVTNATLTVEFDQPRTFNLIRVREPYWFGERAQSYQLEAEAEPGQWLPLGRGTVIGAGNLVPVPETTSKRVRLLVDTAQGCPAISELGVFHSPLVPQRALPSLSTHKPVRASNVHGQGTTFGPDRAVDGDPDTRWATSDETRACWLEVDLGTVQAVGRVAIAELVPRLGKFQIETKTTPDAEWQVVYSGTGKGKDHAHAFTPIQARWVRLNILEASNSPTIWEFQVFAK